MCRGHGEDLLAHNMISGDGGGGGCGVVGGAHDGGRDLDRGDVMHNTQR